MGRDISIAISARDNYTQAITNMRNANQSFNRDLEGLTTRLNSLNNTRINLKMETSQLRRELQDAQRQFAQTGSAADEMAVRLAEADYENAQRNLRLVSQNARQAERDIMRLTDAVNRSENRVGGGSGGTEDAEQSVLSSLAKVGLGKMLGDSLTGAVNVGISSAFGSNLGSAISTTLSGALTGAIMGSVVPGLGTAIGAAVGTAAGGISAAAGYFQKEDDAFKAVRQEIVENALAQQQSELSLAIPIAMGRQKTGVQLRHMFGNEDRAQEYLDNTIALANQTPFFYDDLVGVGSTYKSFGYTNDELYEEQLRIANAAAIRGWDASEMEQVASTLGFMRQSGKIDTMRVKQLQMKGLNIPRYLAIAGSDTGEKLSADDIRTLMGSSEDELLAQGIYLTEDDIYKMISDGKIDGKKAARSISDYMAVEFEGGAGKLAETYYGLESTLGGLQQQMQYALGEGYTEERMHGLQAQNDYFSGESGDQMQEANRLIGQWQASLDNQKDQIQREIMTAVMNGNTTALTLDLFNEDQIATVADLAAQYQQALAEENGAETGRILAQAQIEAQVAYADTDGAKTMKNMQTALIKDTAQALRDSPELYKAYLEVGEAYGAGIMEGISSQLSNPDSWFLGGVSGMKERGADSAFTRWLGGTSSNGNETAPGNAWGISYVPRNDYVTRLHEGEQVLTASEARAQANSGSSQLPPITGNNFYVREDADIYKIAQALATELKKAQMIT